MAVEQTAPLPSAVSENTTNAADSGSSTATRHELDRTMVRGLAWTGIARAVTQALSWASTLIVARLLVPSDYGLVGMAALYLGLIKLLSEFGIGAAVVILRDLTDEQISQLNGFSVLFGFAGFALSCAVAFPLGHFFRAPQLPAVVVVSSLVSVIAGFRSVPMALMQRDMQFKAVSATEMVRAVVGVAIVLVLAALGFGYWSLVLNEVCATAAVTLLTLWWRRQSFAWPRIAALRTAMKLSGDVLVSRTAFYAYQNSDFLVAGRVLGQAVLGTYTFAWTLTNLPVEKITTLVLSVTPSFFSRVQHNNAEIRRYLCVLTEGLAIVTFPVALGLALVAGDFVSVVLGNRWAAAVGPLRVLAAYTSVRTVTPLVSQVLTVTRGTRYVMWNSILSALIFPPAFWIGSHWGATGIAAGWAVIYPFMAAPLYQRLFRDIEMSPREYFGALRPALVSCVAMVIAVVLVQLVFSTGLAKPFRLAAEIAVGGGVYTLLLSTVYRERTAAFVRVVRQVKQ